MEILRTFEIMFWRIDDFQFKFDVLFFLKVVLFILFSEIVDFGHCVLESTLEIFDLVGCLFVHCFGFVDVSLNSVPLWLHNLFSRTHFLLNLHFCIQNFLF